MQFRSFEGKLLLIISSFAFCTSFLVQHCSSEVFEIVYINSSFQLYPSDRGESCSDSEVRK